MCRALTSFNSILLYPTNRAIPSPGGQGLAVVGRCGHVTGTGWIKVLASD